MKKPDLKTFRQTYFQLFLLVTVPIQTWSIFQSFNNFEWIAERTRFWDAIGYVGYALLFGLLESLLATLVLYPVLVVIGKSQGVDKGRLLLCTIFFVGSGWLAFHRIQVFNTGLTTFLWNSIEGGASTADLRLRYQYLLMALLSLLFIASMVLPAWLIFKREPAQRIAAMVFERIEMLGYMFLFLDTLGILIVLLRNILGAINQ